MNPLRECTGCGKITIYHYSNEIYWLAGKSKTTRRKLWYYWW